MFLIFQFPYKVGLELDEKVADAALESKIDDLVHTQVENHQESTKSLNNLDDSDDDADNSDMSPKTKKRLRVQSHSNLTPTNAPVTTLVYTTVPDARRSRSLHIGEPLSAVLPRDIRNKVRKDTFVSHSMAEEARIGFW